MPKSRSCDQSHGRLLQLHKHNDMCIVFIRVLKVDRHNDFLQWVNMDVTMSAFLALLVATIFQ